MFKPIPLANALTAVTVVVYLLCWVIFKVSPDVYNFLFNAYFFGSDMAVLFPPSHEITSLLTTLIVVGISSWLAGFALAFLYKRWSK